MLVRLVVVLLLGLAPGLAAAAADPVAEAADAYGHGDDDLAVRLAGPAAVEGNRDAQYLMGLLQYQGRGGLPQDRCLATLWFDKAARQGHAAAQYRMAMAYHWGYGIPASDANAYGWLLDGTRSGDKDAIAALPIYGARLTEHQRVNQAGRLPPEKRASIDYYFTPVPAALMGDGSIARVWFSPCNGPEPMVPPSRKDVGLHGLPSLEPGMEAFERGDYLRAIELLVPGVIYGRDEATDIIAMLVWTGRGVEADRCRAAIWANEGAGDRPRLAAYLAKAYDAGWGVRCNPEEAYFWARWAYVRQPDVIDPAPYAARLTEEQRRQVAQRVAAQHEKEPVFYILPTAMLEEGGEANPYRKLGLAPCTGN